MIFVLVYSLIFVIGIACASYKNSTVRIISCVSMAIVLSVIMGLRKIDYAGVDTLVYVSDFNRIINNNYSFADIFENFEKDYLFYLFARLFSYLSTDTNLWLLTCSSFYICAISWFIYKYSTNIFLSYIIFTSWQFYLYNFQLVRHVVSLAFVVIAIHFVLKRNLKSYAIAMFGAATSQIVSLVVLPLYWLLTIGRKYKWIVVLGVTLVLSLIALSSRSELISFLFNFQFLQSDRFEHFSQREGGALQNFYICLVFLIVYIFIYSRNKRSIHYVKRKNEMDLFFMMSLIGLICYSMQFVIGEFYRVAQYFSIVIIVMIPSILSMEKDLLIRNIIIAGIVFFCIRHFFGGFWGNPDYFPYRFFFESGYKQVF